MKALTKKLFVKESQLLSSASQERGHATGVRVGENSWKARVMLTVPPAGRSEMIAQERPSMSKTSEKGFLCALLENKQEAAACMKGAPRFSPIGSNTH